MEVWLSYAELELTYNDSNSSVYVILHVSFATSY
jgi:hypothetical protein